MGELVIYEAGEGLPRLAVQLEQESVWLTQRQLGELLDTTPENVLMHLQNVYGDGELSEPATAKEFLVVQTEGTRQVRRSLKHYNLDAIISVGYRVNSKRGTRFRQWATGVLRDHLLAGYTLNRRRLESLGLREAEESLALLARTLENQELVTDAGRDVLAIVVRYARTWRLLLDYDEKQLDAPKARTPAKSAIRYDAAIAAIERMRAELMPRGEASALFGQERGDMLAALLGNVEQSMFGQPLYKSREEKAAHLLYFAIKNHPFTDGNKRIGAFLFVVYLEQEGIASRMSVGALTALTLLIAESRAENKDLMIRLVMHLIAGDAG